MLDILLHANIGQLPDTFPIERHNAQALPRGGDSDDHLIAQRFGDQWLQEARSAALVVLSVVAAPEWNALINPLHPNANQFLVSASQKVIWDQRLFTRRNA